MRNQKKIMKEIKAVGLRVEIADSGFLVYPKDSFINTIRLDKLVAIAQKYTLGHYINFDGGYMRLYYQRNI